MTTHWHSRNAHLWRSLYECPNMDMPKYGGEVVTWRMSQLSTHQSDCRYGQIWRPSCPEQQIRPLCPYMVMYICYKSNAHNNNIYGDSPSAAMPKYGVCCLTSCTATNEACPNMGNGHSGWICCSGQLGLHIWAYSICSQTGVLTIVTSQCWVWAPN